LSFLSLRKYREEEGEREGKCRRRGGWKDKRRARNPGVNLGR
jgi:hypothetical protein